jgi:hypothetical protein
MGEERRMTERTGAEEGREGRKGDGGKTLAERLAGGVAVEGWRAEANRRTPDRRNLRVKETMRQSQREANEQSNSAVGDINETGRNLHVGVTTRVNYRED